MKEGRRGKKREEEGRVKVRYSHVVLRLRWNHGWAIVVPLMSLSTTFSHHPLHILLHARHKDPKFPCDQCQQKQVQSRIPLQCRRAQVVHKFFLFFSFSFSLSFPFPFWSNFAFAPFSLLSLLFSFSISYPLTHSLFLSLSLLLSSSLSVSPSSHRLLSLNFFLFSTLPLLHLARFHQYPCRLDMMVWDHPSECVEHLRRKGLRIAIADCEGATPMEEVDFTRPTAVVLGNELTGISQQVWGWECTL